MSTSIELLESLSPEVQEKVSQDYEAHVKACVAKGTQPMQPNAFVSAARPELEVKAREHSERIGVEFKQIMIRNGYGSTIERAMHNVSDAMSGIYLGE